MLAASAVHAQATTEPGAIIPAATTEEGAIIPAATTEPGAIIPPSPTGDDVITPSIQEGDLPSSLTGEISGFTTSPSPSGGSGSGSGTTSGNSPVSTADSAAGRWRVGGALLVGAAVGAALLAC